MATFNIVSINGETGTIRSDGINWFELLTNPLGRDWQIVGEPVIKQGILVGAQHRPVVINERKVLVPRKLGEVAWAGETSPITRTSNDGKLYAVSGSVQTVRTEADGYRHLIVSPVEGEKAVLALVDSGLSGNKKQQEETLLRMLAQGKPYFEHGTFAVDDGARGLVRKIRTSLTRSGGVLTRVKQFVEVKPGGQILVAGMLEENAVWRFVNEDGRLRRVDAGQNPRATFAKLRMEQRRSNADQQDEMPAAA